MAFLPNAEPQGRCKSNTFYSIINYFQDFDSTRQFYKQYLAKWIRYLHATCTRYPSGAVAIFLKVDDSKRKLDELLTEWKPSNLIQNPMNMDLNEVRLILWS